MRGHPWFLWRRQSPAVVAGNAGDLRTMPWRRSFSVPAGAGVNGDYRGFFLWFRYGIQAQGKVCIGVIGMTIPGASFAMTTAGASFAMTSGGASFVLATTGATLALTTTGATIEFEDCS
jgi:hypothetical protein